MSRLVLGELEQMLGKAKDTINAIYLNSGRATYQPQLYWESRDET
jgi:hypothetical protein